MRNGRMLRVGGLLCLLLCLAVVLHVSVLSPRMQCLASLDMGSQPLEPVDAVNRIHLNKPKVDVEVFVMSKCPDGEDGENTIADVMEKVASKVALNFTYIARKQNTSQGFWISCMHGPTECLGNKQQLCFQKYHPTKILPFITCLNKDPDQIGNSLSYTLHCADKAGVLDYPTLIQPCAESLEGHNLLLQSVERCDALNTHLSATFRVAGKNVCIRDGGEWRECREVLGLGGGDVALGLQRLIEKEYKKLSTANRLFWQLGSP